MLAPNIKIPGEKAALFAGGYWDKEWERVLMVREGGRQFWHGSTESRRGESVKGQRDCVKWGSTCAAGIEPKGQSAGRGFKGMENSR